MTESVETGTPRCSSCGLKFEPSDNFAEDMWSCRSCGKYTQVQSRAAKVETGTPRNDNPFEPDETPTQQNARVGRMIRENADKRMLAESRAAAPSETPCDDPSHCQYATCRLTGACHFPQKASERVMSPQEWRTNHEDYEPYSLQMEFWHDGHAGAYADYRVSQALAARDKPVQELIDLYLHRWDVATKRAENAEAERDELLRLRDHDATCYRESLAKLEARVKELEP